MKLGKADGWNYSALADSYDSRPDYDKELVCDVVQAMRLAGCDLVLDVGAGTGKLTGLLASLGLHVIACEPNPEMRSIGVRKSHRHAMWVAGAGEALPVGGGNVALTSFGSSFNVLPAASALDECARVLRPGGFWLALWNHRDLEDPLQRAVEAIIHRHVSNYDYGRRRQDPSADVAGHGAFGAVGFRERRFIVKIRSEAWLQAWKSHATLLRQAGSAIGRIMEELGALVGDQPELSVPYWTRAWMARRLRA